VLQGSRFWYPGTIAALNLEGTLHIVYDDGNIEKRVRFRDVRPLLPALPDAVTQPRPLADVSPACAGTHVPHVCPELRQECARAAALPAALAVGSRVEARWMSRKWYPGTLAARNANGTLRIDFDDGEVEDGVLPHHVTPFVPLFGINAKVVIAALGSPAYLNGCAGTVRDTYLHDNTQWWYEVSLELYTPVCAWVPEASLTYDTGHGSLRLPEPPPQLEAVYEDAARSSLRREVLLSREREAAKRESPSVEEREAKRESPSVEEREAWACAGTEGSVQQRCSATETDGDAGAPASQAARLVLVRRMMYMPALERAVADLSCWEEEPRAPAPLVAVRARYPSNVVDLDDSDYDMDAPCAPTAEAKEATMKRDLSVAVEAEQTREWSTEAGIVRVVWRAAAPATSPTAVTAALLPQQSTSSAVWRVSVPSYEGVAVSQAVSVESLEAVRRLVAGAAVFWAEYEVVALEKSASGFYARPTDWTCELSEQAPEVEESRVIPEGCLLLRFEEQGWRWRAVDTELGGAWLGDQWVAGPTDPKRGRWDDPGCGSVKSDTATGHAHDGETCPLKKGRVREGEV